MCLVGANTYVKPMLQFKCCPVGKILDCVITGRISSLWEGNASVIPVCLITGGSN